MRIAMLKFLFLVWANATVAQEIIATDILAGLTQEEIKELANEWDDFSSSIDKQGLSLFVGEDEKLTMEKKAERGIVLHEFRAMPFTKGSSDFNLWYLVMIQQEVEKLNDKKIWLEILLNDLKTRHPANAPYVSGKVEYDQFSLWTGCNYLLPRYIFNNRLLSGEHEAENEFERSVIAAVDSRVRGARLYPPSGDDSTIDEMKLLEITVVLGDGQSFYIDINLMKSLFDTKTRMKVIIPSTGGNYRIFGTAQPESIRNFLADQLDRFLADYLRVNADSC